MEISQFLSVNIGQICLKVWKVLDTKSTLHVCLYVVCVFRVMYYNRLQYIIIYYKILEYIRKLQMCCPILLLQYRTTMTTTSETPLLCLYVFCGFYVIFYNILRYITVYYSIYYNILEYIIIYYNILEHIRKLQMCCPIFCYNIGRQ